MFTLTFSASCFLLFVIKTRITSLLCGLLQKACLQLVCSCRYSHSQLRKRKQKVVAQGPSCLMQLNVSSAWVLTASTHDPGRHSHSTLDGSSLPPTWKHETLSLPSHSCIQREFQVNHMWIIYSGIAEYDKIEVLASNTACHDLSCGWYGYVNKDVSRLPSAVHSLVGALKLLLASP